MMDTLVIGISNDILRISTSEFTLYLSGNSENKKFRATNNNKNVKAFLNVSSTIDDTSISTLNSFGELEENNSNTMCPSFFEDGAYNIYLENDTTEHFEIHHIDKEIRENIVSRRRDVHGSFKFNGDIGYSTFKVLKNNVEVLSFTIQVFPTKLDYLDDYNELLREVNDEINSLVFDYLGKTFSSVDLVDVKKQTGIEFITILNGIFDNLQRAIKRIENHPKHGVLNEYNLKDQNKCRKVCTKQTINHLRKNQQSTKAVEVVKRTTLDIHENRYVKYIIKRIIKRIDKVKSDIARSKGVDNVHYNRLSSFENRLKLHLNTFFKDISDITGNKSMTLVFKMASGYKEVYYYYTLLSKGLDIFSGIYDISHKKLWSLYEIWCYIKIHNIIKEIGYVPQNSFIIQSTSNGITLSLMQGKKAKGIYINDKGEKLELWYNKPYYGLPTTNQRPDTVLCLKGDNTSDRVYIFDAKYRLDIDKSGVIGPMEEDINVMHRYRDSIVSENKLDEHYKYETFGAYVMFPCSDENSFVGHKYYKSIDKVNIGAIPMLPGSTSLMKKHICDILDQSYVEAINNNPVFDEGDDYYRFKNKNAMIVNTKDKEHFDIYKKSRFYHIPVKSLSNVKLGVEYLAFYQPKGTFGDDSGICYFAKIKDYYRYKRGECREIGCSDSKTDLEYIRFELEDFERVGPIKSVEYGPVVVNYTTMYLLKSARYVHELYLKSRKEIDVYKLLRGVSDDKGIRLTRDKSGFCIGDDRVSVSDKGEVRLNNELCSLKKLSEIYLT